MICRTRTVNGLTRAFTLIEILIVVVILGILAAIVIPQFTNASDDAKNSSVQSQLQTVRGQIELYNVQGTGPGYPAFTGGLWDELTTHNYLQSAPRNAMRDNATGVVIGDLGPGDPSTGGAGDGWVWNSTTHIMYAIDATGAVFNW